MKKYVKNILCLMALMPSLSMAQTYMNYYNVQNVIDAPSLYLGMATTPVTDSTAGTGWDISEGESITVGWNNGIVANGAGTIEVYTAVFAVPWGTGSGFVVRFLLEDGSYSNEVTYPAEIGTKQIINSTFASRMIFAISDIYGGPLSIKGIELSDFTRHAGGVNSPAPSTSLRLVRAAGVTVIPETSSALMIAATTCMLSIRRKRPRLL